MPDIDNIKYMYDFHVHSLGSGDCDIRPSDIKKIIKSTRLHCIAVTDHDNFSPDLNTSCIKAEEKTCCDGTHIIGLFIKDKLNRGDISELFAEIKDNGGIVLVPHLFRKDTGLFANKGYDEAIEILKQADAMEVYNSKSSEDENERSLQLWKKFQHLIPIAASDAHYLCEIGNAVVEISEPLVDAESLKRAYSSGDLRLLRYKQKGEHKKSTVSQVSSRFLFKTSKSAHRVARNIKHLIKGNYSILFKSFKNGKYEDILRLEK